MDKINKNYIELKAFLKLHNLVLSGGEVKYFLKENDLYVNNQKEERRGRKLYKGDIVRINDKEFVVDDYK